MSRNSGSGFWNWSARHSFSLTLRITGWRAYAENLVDTYKGGACREEFNQIEAAYLKLFSNYLDARRWLECRKALNIAARASRHEPVTTNIDTEAFDPIDDETRKYVLYRDLGWIKHVNGKKYVLPNRETGSGAAGIVYKAYGEPILVKIGHRDYNRALPHHQTGAMMESDQDTIADRFRMEVFGLKFINLIEHPRLIACAVVYHDIHDSKYERPWLAKEFIFGPEYKMLNQNRWGLNHEEIIEAKQQFREIVDLFCTIDLSPVIERIKKEGWSNNSVSFEKILNHKRIQDYIKLLRGTKTFGFMDRPKRNMIYCLDSDSPNFKKWVIIDH